MTTKRKLAVLAGTMVATALASIGFAAQDDESPLHKAMEKVQIANSTILKGVRNPVQFKKSQADVVAAAKELVALGKESREYTEPAKEQKKPVETWHELMDKMITEAGSFAEEADKKDADQREVKTAYRKVQATCTACHDVFRIEE